jgi:hypothetical protein
VELAAVIWKPLVKGWPVVARSFVLALPLLLCATLFGWTAEPAGAPIVLQLQLPPSTSPEAVRGMIADLAAKGARPVTQPNKPPGAAALPALTAATLATRAWNGSKQAIQALPVLRQAPQTWIAKVEADGGTQGVAVGFWFVVLAGLMAAPLIGMAFRALADRQETGIAGPHTRVRIALTWFIAEIASLTFFGVFFWAALLWVARGVPILRESADQLVLFALKWRFLITVLRIVVSPQRADLRLLAIDDIDARITFRWVAVYLALSTLSSFLIFWLVERLGFRHGVVFGAAIAGGLAFVAFKVAMFWAIRRPIARAILAAAGSEPGPVRRSVAAAWHWFFIALAFGVFLTAVIQFSLGRGISEAVSAAIATQGIVITLVVLGQASHKLMARLFLAHPADARLALRRERLSRALHRLSDVSI